MMKIATVTFLAGELPQLASGQGAEYVVTVGLSAEIDRREHGATTKLMVLQAVNGGVSSVGWVASSA
jgi:hypothetical protein